MAPVPGILYVTMQPQPGLPDAQFTDWYNNEHGPHRLRLSFIPNGFRYRATDLQGQAGTKEKPEWMAIYDVTDMATMKGAAYLALREDGIKTQREKDTMKQIAVDRRLYDLISSSQAKEFKKLEDVGASEENFMIALSVYLQPGKKEAYDKWFEEEHLPMLSKIPGWLRTQRFVSSYVEPKDDPEYLTLHEFAPENGIASKEFLAVMSTPAYKDVMTNDVRQKTRRMYSLYYTFGPAPRDLAPLSSSDTALFTSNDGQTKTMPSPSGGSLESFITTRDGVTIPFRLDGSTDPHAPLIVLSNSILVQWGIWDAFVKSFLSIPSNKKYRILRYMTRGRSSACGDTPITIDVLAADIIALLDAIRVPQAAALIGVSLGGITVLNTALKYPNRIAAFMSCDTSAKSPAGNSEAWGSRITMAEAEGAVSASGEAVVGEKLAEATVRRWFVPETYDGAAMEEEANRVKAMVASNSLAGFKKSVQALFSYDVTEEMKKSKGKGAFLVGAGDGVLPSVLEKMAADFGGDGKGAFFKIEGAGHLPMVEKPKEVAEALTKFLA